MTEPDIATTVHEPANLLADTSATTVPTEPKPLTPIQRAELIKRLTERGGFRRNRVWGTRKKKRRAAAASLLLKPDAMQDTPSAPTATEEPERVMADRTIYDTFSDGSLRKREGRRLTRTQKKANKRRRQRA